jgi:nondiscriminating glutamyl-tRNA synthetase
MEEMAQQFSLDRLNSSPAVFDEVKLKWMNATHLRALPHGDLWKRLQPFFKEAGFNLSDDVNWQDRALSVFKTSMETLVDAVELFRPMDDSQFSITAEGEEVLQWDTSKKVLDFWQEYLQTMGSEFMTEDEFLAGINEIGKKGGVKGKFLFMPMRVAVIGQPHGAELKILVPLLAKKSLLARAQECLNKL